MSPYENKCWRYLWTGVGNMHTAGILHAAFLYAVLGVLGGKKIMSLHQQFSFALLHHIDCSLLCPIHNVFLNLIAYFPNQGRGNESRWRGVMEQEKGGDGKSCVYREDILQ